MYSAKLRSTKEPRTSRIAVPFDVEYLGKRVSTSQMTRSVLRRSEEVSLKMGGNQTGQRYIRVGKSD